MDNIDWIGIAEKVGIAIVIVIVTWIVAKIVSWAIGKLVVKVPALQRQGSDGRPIGASIGSIGSLIVWLFGLVAVLQVFALDAVLAPIQGLLQGVMEFLPNVIGAAFVLFIGYIIAKIAGQLVETSVGMVNFGGLAARMKKVGPTPAAQTPTAAEASGQAPGEAGTQFAPGASPAGAHQPGGGVDSRKIASILGNLVFAIILIVVAIASLQILRISAISDPAEHMLDLILGAIPAIIAAVLILGIGYAIARFVGALLEGTLRGLGTDRAIASMGIVSEGRSASTILTRIAQVAIMVFFAIMAARALGFPEVTRILDEVLTLGGQVLFGGVIIAAGFLVAKLVANAIGSGTTSVVVRYATIVLFVAMGLKFMGIADSIITLAFGAVVIGGALAAVLAFGLGGRDAAARTLERMQAKQAASPTEPGTPRA